MLVAVDKAVAGAQSTAPDALRIKERDVPECWRALTSAVSPRIARVLAARGVASLDDLDLRLAGLRPAHGLAGLSAAAERLAQAIGDGERILVVGDFDADGATGTAVAVRGLRALGARHVQFAVPDRQRHGYGLSVSLVDELLARAPAVLMTVDHGTSSLAGVERARAAGVDVIVTDHHLPGEQLPRALALVNPNAQGGRHELASLAGVGVVFHVLAAVRAKLERDGNLVTPVVLASLLDLVALGTVADLVPLERDNRIMINAGLRRIREGRASTGLAAMIESAGRDPRRLTATDLGFQIGPRLNAAGRLDDMSLGIRCLISDDVDEARELAAQLSELNRERRSLQADMEREAASIVERLLTQRSGQLPAALVVADPGWHAGVVGLVASRLVEKLHRPTLALAPAAEGSAEWRGSGRSIPGFHLRDALVEVDRREPGLLTRYGGHAMAAGMSLPGSGSERLARSFEVVTEKLLDADARTRTVWTDGGLAADEFTLELAHAIEAAGPFGQGFAEPLFDNEFTVVERRVLKDKHLKLRLQAGSSRRYLDAIWFSAPAPWLQYTPARLRLLYQLAVERYQGVESLSVRIRHGLTL